MPTYKRLTLMLRDPDRLRALLTDPERPIQLVLAGKSHPADIQGTPGFCQRLDKAPEHILLIVEIIIKYRAGDTRTLDDFADAGAFIALFGKEV